jgi:hypothetical protein
MPIDARIVTQIFQRIHEGCLLKNALVELNVASWEFFDFIHDNPIHSEAYGRAQKARAEMLVDEIIDISDTEPDAQKARNRIDARKWVASKLQPQKFGDRLDVNVAGTVDIGAALLAAKARAALPQHDPRDIIEGEIVESKQLQDKSHADYKSVDSLKPLQIEGAKDGDAAIIPADDIFG